MDGKVRPIGAKILAGVSLLNSLYFLVAGFMNGTVIFGLVVGALLLGLSYSLYIGKNWSWTLMIISSSLGILGAIGIVTGNTPIAVTNLSSAIFGLVAIIIALMPSTKAFYNDKTSGTNQLTIGGKGFKIFLIVMVVFGIFLLIAPRL